MHARVTTCVHIHTHRSSRSAPVQASHSSRLLPCLSRGGVALLVHTRDIGEWFATELQKRGIPARFFDGKSLDLTARAVKVMTLHSAKGLEFPVVVVAGLWPGAWPGRDSFDHEQAYLEELGAHRRLLYVGLSRAMRSLTLLQAADCADPALDSLVADHWEIRS